MSDPIITVPRIPPDNRIAHLYRDPDQPITPGLESYTLVTYRRGDGIPLTQEILTAHGHRGATVEAILHLGLAHDHPVNIRFGDHAGHRRDAGWISDQWTDRDDRDRLGQILP